MTKPEPMGSRELNLSAITFPREVPLAMPSASFMASIRSEPLAPGESGLWFLGQNTWILKAPDGTTICIDPYLTDWCGSRETWVRTPKSRLLPIFIEPEDLDVDLVILTHSHSDHCDPLTLRRLSAKDGTHFMAPWQCLPTLDAAGIPASRVRLLHPLETLSIGPVRITGTFALPTSFSDLNHIGIILQSETGRTYYNSGDTAYSDLLSHVRQFSPDVMSICINGGYNNLSHWDAAKVVAAIKPRVAMPAHFDMMPHNLQPPHMFQKSLWEQAPDVLYHKLEYYSCFRF